MRVLLATYGSRGDVEPLVGLAVRLRALGAEVRVCAPPDKEFAELLAGVGVPLMPVGPPMGSMVRPSSAADASRRVSELAALFDTVAAAAEGCEALLATGLAHFASRSVAEKLGIPYVYATFCAFLLPSPHHAPPPLVLPGQSLPPEVTDNRVLWDLNAQSFNALHGEALNTHRASIGLPPVDDVRNFIFTDHPWLAADPTLGPWQETSDLDVVRTGAWILPDERPLPAELVAFLDAGAPPVYVGFGSMRSVSEDIARVAIEAIRAQGRRVLVGRGWADLTLIGPGRLLRRRRGQPAGTVRPGGRRRAPRRRGYDDDGRPGRRSSGGGTPGGGPAVLGRPGGRPGHRRGTRRSDSDHRVLVSRAQDGPDPRDPRTSDRRGRHDPHRRGDGGRDAADRRGQPRKAASVRVNHAGPSSHCPEHEKPWRPEPTTPLGSMSGGALLVMATRYAGPDALPHAMVASDLRSEPMT
jgi:vancomycin aglycone glucosyltransferase